MTNSKLIGKVALKMLKHLWEIIQILAIGFFILAPTVFIIGYIISWTTLIWWVPSTIFSHDIRPEWYSPAWSVLGVLLGGAYALIHTAVEGIVNIFKEVILEVKGEDLND